VATPRRGSAFGWSKTRTLSRVCVLTAVLVAASACGSEGRPGEGGGKIAFTENSLIIVNADGSGTPTTPSQPFGVIAPTWSPDGSRLVFEEEDYVSAIAPDGSHYARVHFIDNSGTTGWTWSGKSDELAYVNDEPAKIFAVGADGHGRRKITNGDAPTWSPDGQAIAFVRGGFIRVIGSDGTGERKVARLHGDPEYVGDSGSTGGTLLWSSDSKKVAYTTSGWKNPKTECESGGDCNYVNPDTNTQVCRIHIVRVADGSEVHVDGGGLLGSYENQCDFDWSPDGKQIAFGRNGFLDVASADGKRERRIGRGLSPLWSPEGSHIAVKILHPYTGGPFSQPNATIYVIDMQRKTERRVAPADDRSWSPDGKALVVARTIKNPEQDDSGNYTPGEWVIETYDAAGKRLRKLWPNVGTCECGEPVWQP
jgi:Tol biopolymer transport system component